MYFFCIYCSRQHFDSFFLVVGDVRESFVSSVEGGVAGSSRISSFEFFSDFFSLFRVLKHLLGVFIPLILRCSESG
jgi:hypothetical protein